MDVWSFKVFYVWSEVVWRIQTPNLPLSFVDIHLFASILVSAGWCEARLTVPQ